MKDTLSLDEIQHIAVTAREWIASPEGQQVVQKSLAEARDMAAKFREAQRIDLSILNEPFTI